MIMETASTSLPDLSAGDDLDSAYAAWCKILINAAKQSIPCRCRNTFIPMWDADCQQCYEEFIGEQPGPTADDKATELMKCLDEKKRLR